MAGDKVKWWRWGREQAVLQTTDPATARQISAWKFAKLWGRGVNHYRRLFIIPSAKLAEACRLLDIPEPAKHPARVRAGKANQANLKGQLSLFDADEGPGQDG